MISEKRSADFSFSALLVENPLLVDSVISLDLENTSSSVMLGASFPNEVSPLPSAADNWSLIASSRLHTMSLIDGRSMPLSPRQATAVSTNLVRHSAGLAHKTSRRTTPNE